MSYPQPAYQPVDPQNAAAFGWGQPAPAPERPRTLGVTAMVVALAVFVLSIGASVVVGMSAGPLAERSATGFALTTDSLTPEQAQSFAPAAIVMGAQLLLGTVLGIVAVVLGIVAVATKRGRPFGIIAIIAAAAAPVVSFAVYMGSLMATIPSA